VTGDLLFGDGHGFLPFPGGEAGPAGTPLRARSPRPPLRPSRLLRHPTIRSGRSLVVHAVLPNEAPPPAQHRPACDIWHRGLLRRIIYFTSAIATERSTCKGWSKTVARGGRRNSVALLDEGSCRLRRDGMVRRERREPSGSVHGHGTRDGGSTGGTGRGVVEAGGMPAIRSSLGHAAADAGACVAAGASASGQDGSAGDRSVAGSAVGPDRGRPALGLGFRDFFPAIGIPFAGSGSCAR